jgi:hypothetical protein
MIFLSANPMTDMEKKSYFVWFDGNSHAVFETYELAWKASEAYFADTGKCALVEEITAQEDN